MLGSSPGDAYGDGLSFCPTCKFDPSKRLRVALGTQVVHAHLDQTRPSVEPQVFHQQANWCYQLAWQCFDLAAANKLNAMGNKHTAKARELSWQERKARQTQKLVDHRTDYNALPTITY